MKNNITLTDEDTNYFDRFKWRITACTELKPLFEYDITYLKEVLEVLAKPKRTDIQYGVAPEDNGFIEPITKAINVIDEYERLKKLEMI